MVSRERKIEIMSVLITSVVLGYIGVISGIQLIAVDTPPARSITIKVIAEQFLWTFEYPNGTRVQNELRVKAGQVVLLEVTSLDVIHSFFVYDLGVKIDANPGHVNHYWFRADTPGQYRIFCAEFCGVSHYAMIGKLIVEP